MSIRLTKYQALSNDYLLLDLPGPLRRLVAALPILCDRHLGAGSDGLLAFDAAAMSVRVFNPDGGEAQKSGNGLRIAAAHAVLEHGAPETFRLRTIDSYNAVRVKKVAGSRVVSELDLGPPSFRTADLPALAEAEEPGLLTIETSAGSVRAALVSVGNPHCVVFDESVTRERCQELGPLLERHPMFPERTNVQLAQVLGRRRAKIEIWERGAGYTLASGTSAAAVAAALMRERMVGPAVAIEMPGGELTVENRGGRLFQSGPAQRVYRAEIDLEDLVPRASG
ncbi:MAG: diaminopimelate epimerase [Candidatus Dormibacteraceae bacterium]